MHVPDLEQELLPTEAATFLGISTQKLSRLRRNGKVVGTQVGKTNLYTYSIANLRKADLQKERRGPKPKKKEQAG